MYRREMVSSPAGVIHGLPEDGKEHGEKLSKMSWTLKDAQKWLGHSDIKRTANVYSHLDNARKNTIAAMLMQNVS